MKKLTQTWNWRGHARLRIGLLAAAMFLTRDVASGQLATLDERTRGAEVVVVATVGTITPKWVSNDYGDRLIVSRVELRIDETLKGTPQQTAWLELMGGTLDGYTLHVSSLPAVQNGERGVFFLHLLNGGATYWPALIPSIALKTPLVLRPGSAEPWTPYRLIQALIKAGIPREAFCFYPSGHAGAGEIVRSTGRSMFFGDVGAVGTVAGDPRVELHGPGYSKLFIGADRVSSWKDYIALIAASVVENGGRSCVNASGVWVPSHAKEIADALAERLAKVEPRAADDERAEIAPFVDPAVAARISQQIDAGLYEAGAEDVTAKYRKGERLVEKNGATYLLPTVVRCDSSQHPLANREFLFPFVSVVQMNEEEAAAVPECFGPTLVVTALTEDRRTIDRLLSSDLVGRLNLGPIQTNRIVWDQPHEGNLFEHLYGRRAFQRAG